MDNLKNNAEFFIEYFAIDLIMTDSGECQGLIAWKLDDGSLHRFNAKLVVLATGGYGRAYFSATSYILAPAMATEWLLAEITSSRHGVRSVSPHRDIWCWLSHYRGSSG